MSLMVKSFVNNNFQMKKKTHYFALDSRYFLNVNFSIVKLQI